MKTLLLLLIFIGLCLLGYQAMNIKHHSEQDDHSSLRRRWKRSGTYEEPLQVSKKKAYLQAGHAYELPCTVIRPGDSVSIVFWLRGESMDPAKRDVILRQAYPNDGLNFALDRYQISSSHGIIIDPVNMADTNWYWCKTVRKPANQFVEDYLDVTVVDKTFPKDNDTIVDETSVSLSIESETTIQCPLLPQAPTEIDTTVYWSILTDKDQNNSIIFAKFSNGDTLSVQEYAGTHGPEGNNGLYIKSFKRRDERYCCHMFEEGSNLRTACIDVTWLALATERRPTILDCDSTGESCELEISPHQDCLHLECSIDDVYPKPTLNWSYTNCVESPTFFTTSSSTENHTHEVFNVRSKVYLVGLKTSFDDCSLVCTARGEAIPDQTEPASVTITRLTETTTSRIVTSTRTFSDCNSSRCVGPIVLLAVAVLLIVVLIFQKRCKCVQFHVGGIHKQSADSPEEMMVTTSLMSTRDKDHGIAEEKKDEVCLEKRKGNEIDITDKVCIENRGSKDVDITDANFIWNYLGQLVTEPALEMENENGFKAITDVIGIQNGGVVVIDSKGLHLFTVEYHYRFTDLYGALGDKGHTCVAHFRNDKLLFGLQWGKLVTFDIVNEQVTNFGSVSPEEDKIVLLNGLAVGSLGYVFASDENGQIISVFDHEGVYLKRLGSPKIQPGSLALQVCQKELNFFVTSGQVVRKYHISGEKEQTKIKHVNYLNINKITLGVERLKPGHISLQEDKLLVVNHLDDPGLLQILILDVNNGAFQQSIIAKAPGIRDVKFISGDRIVLFSGDSVHVFEKGNAK